jgi:hypothetical protein
MAGAREDPGIEQQSHGSRRFDAHTLELVDRGDLEHQRADARHDGQRTADPPVRAGAEQNDRRLAEQVRLIHLAEAREATVRNRCGERRDSSVSPSSGRPWVPGGSGNSRIGPDSDGMERGEAIAGVLS